MNNKLESIDYKGYTINTFYDESPENPRDWDNVSKFIFFHKRYTLGDTHNINPHDYNSLEEIERAIEQEFNPRILLPVYMYDHSNISFSLAPYNDRWDSGQIGYAIVTQVDIENCMGNWKRITKNRRDVLIKNIKSELKTYQNFCNGECYGFEIEDEEEQLLDSCWGYYDYEDMVEECRDIIEQDIKEIEEKAWSHVE